MTMSVKIGNSLDCYTHWTAEYITVVVSVEDAIVDIDRGA